MGWESYGRPKVKETRTLLGLATDWLVKEFPTLAPKDKLKVALAVCAKAVPQTQNVNQVSLNLEQVRVIEEKAQEAVMEEERKKLNDRVGVNGGSGTLPS